MIVRHQVGELDEQVERRLLLLRQEDVFRMQRHAVDLAGDQARQPPGGAPAR